MTKEMDAYRPNTTTCTITVDGFMTKHTIHYKTTEFSCYLLK